MLVTEANKRAMERITRQYKTNNSRAGAMLTSLEYGGPNVGGDMGVIFLVTWVLWCILYFDGAGTERPNWPWLDWLG
jgi:hypothetical protein